MNGWDALGLWAKLYVGIRCTIREMQTFGRDAWALPIGTLGALLLGWFVMDVVLYIKRNGGGDRRVE